ncbi:D-isomer specific 2-hydroxyacid dehydrogenase, NAD binding domain protein [Mycobacterium xenopi 4042]|uniref:D-isomer specific 2-hydroxyacid dehydrogenase, NAD binding domain protein n=1 Tax=Mycobacterium xenopi 4042 TaxID=1299334 RepID=X7Z3X4_MYCXE|nr:D-isomer specific 2-hydroxyacid dehydrogenase, NAD binding domain protein [Mycobacterium xenopi 4042]
MALAEAVRSGHVRAAGIDVFAKEPCTDSPLFELPQIVVTPHLGASTAEAQDRAGTDVAESVKLALAGKFVPDAVNVGAGRSARRWRRGWIWCANSVCLLVLFATSFRCRCRCRHAVS